LLARGQCSRLHRIQSDEVWHFYRGSALEIPIIAPGGRGLAQSKRYTAV
jgi:predicted cupin superfamily sugar epimerase